MAMCDGVAARAGVDCIRSCGVTEGDEVDK